MKEKSLSTILRKNLGIILLVLFCCIFYWRIQVAQAELALINSQIRTDLERQAELAQELKEMKPYRKKGQPAPELTARAAVSVLIDKEGKEVSEEQES